MPKILLAAGLSVCLGVGLLVLYSASPVPRTGFDADAPAKDRLLALESSLDEERRARQLLEEELFRLIDEVEQLRGVAETAGNAVADEAVEEQDQISRLAEVQNRIARRGRRGNVSRAEQLIAGGFSPDRAENIARREAELSMEAMQARFEARQAGEPLSSFQGQLGVAQALREELGDTEYEQYLEASDRPTSVGIRSVLEFSPAAQAGLQGGDRIVRYNGARVFNMAELRRLQVQEDIGANVVVEVIRDGAPIQVTVPRGPLGVTGGWGR